MRKTLVALAGVLALAATSPVMAQDYLSGNVGDDNTTVALGRDFGTTRAEIQYASLTNVGQFSQDARVLSVNGYLQPYSFGPVTPYLTAGVGFGQISGAGQSDEGFVANAGLGADYELNDNWVLNAEWRTYTGDVRERVRGDRSDNFNADVASIGVRYRF